MVNTKHDPNVYLMLLHLLNTEAANKLEIELELTRDSAEKLVGFKEEFSETKVLK